MEDDRIVELFFLRDDDAINQVQTKYFGYLNKIAMNILGNREDSLECVNDTYFKAWQTIPPNRPKRLSYYLGKIVRELSIYRWRRNTAKKHGGSQLDVSLDELADCLPAGLSIEEETEGKRLSAVISEYLKLCGEKQSDIFIMRYYFCDSIKEISAAMSLSETNVRSILFRTRQGLKSHLEKEGYTV